MKTRSHGNAELQSWSNAQLCQACLHGDERAWSALIDRYKNLIFSIPLKQGLTPEDAAEIFQAVCISLMTELPQLRDPGALPAWLIRVTNNRCHHWRRQQRQRAQIEQPAWEDAGDAAPASDEALRQIELKQVLSTALDGLSPRCRRLLTMLFFESPARPYIEIAASLGLAQGSIGFTRARCLAKLKLMLASEFKS